MFAGHCYRCASGEGFLCRPRPIEIGGILSGQHRHVRRRQIFRRLVLDAETGIAYNKYGKYGIINAQTSIVYERLEDNPDNYDEAIKINGTWYLPNRRHLKAPALKAELEAEGFRVLYQEGEYGENVICMKA